jgi:AcrR family transcriptional regulator
VKNSVVGVIQGTADQVPETGRPARADGRRSRWDSHRAARREELIMAAVAAIAEHGPSVGMDQIAARARTSKPVVYRYVADKSDLYRAVSTRLVEQVLARLLAVAGQNPPPRALIHASIDGYLALLESSPQLYRFLAAHPFIDTPSGSVSSFSTVVAELLSTQLAGQLAEGGLDPALAHPWGEGIVGFITSTSMWWLDHRESMTRPQLSAYLGALLWGGAAGVYQYVGQPADARPPAGVFEALST